MRKYYFAWFNYHAQREQVDFVLAENIDEARQIAINIMKYFGGNGYNNYDIEVIDEVSDDYYFNIDRIKKMYEKDGREFILPEIK